MGPECPAKLAKLVLDRKSQILITESAVPVPKIMASGWNLAHVSGTGADGAESEADASPSVEGAEAAEDTRRSTLPVRMSENAQCSSIEHDRR